MKQIVCPLCDSPEFEPVADVHDRLLGTDGHFSMVHCSRCGLHYLNPQPSPAELARYYPETYEIFGTPSPARLPLLQRLVLNYGLRKRCRAVMRYKKGGRLLEIGCANGLFLNAMRGLGGWQLQGVDTSEVAVRYAREELGLDVFAGPVEEAQFPDRAFDVVVMWDVLEHVHRPKETLAEIHRILSPNGVFVFRVPQLDSWDRRLFGPYWVGWEAPRHLTVFSMRTLTQMMEKTGFRIKRIGYNSGSYLAFAWSVRFWAKEHLSPSVRERLRRILEALPVRLVVAPYFYLVDRLGKSTNVTCLAWSEDHGHQTSNKEGFGS